MLEKLLFAVHMGQVSGRPAGIIMAGHCLPIACSHSSYDGHGAPVAEDGIYACWESTTDADEFFGLGGIGLGEGIKAPRRPSVPDHPGVRPSGLYVYEVEYPESSVVEEEDMEDWPWLMGGALRRPTAEELEPLSRGQAPWGGVVL